jgi:lysophospholipase L1-like esterase
MRKILLALCCLCLTVSAQSLPQCVNRDRLQSFDAQTSNLKANQDGIINVVWLGDSLTTTETTTEPMRRLLHARYGDAGVGFVRFDSSGYPYNTIVHSTGEWGERYQRPEALGVHINDSTSSEPGASKSAFINGTYNVDSITIHYIKQPKGGKFRYRIDGGKWHKVKTKGNLRLATKTIDELSVANHSVTVEVVKGPVTVIGADFQIGQHGAKVHMFGNTGSRASQWVKVNSEIWQQGLKALNPTLVALQFSTNEQSWLESPETLVASYRTLISWIRLAAPDADILLTTDPDTANSVNPACWPTSEYSNAVRQLAESEGVGFLDFCAHLGPYAEGNAAGYYTDTVHLTNAGGQILAEFVAAYLNRECDQ